MKLPLQFVNQPLPYFLTDIITTNKNAESLRRSDDSGLCSLGLLFSGVRMGFLFYFLEIEKRPSRFNAPTSLLFSQYKPDLSYLPCRRRSSKYKKPYFDSPIRSAQHFMLRNLIAFSWTPSVFHYLYRNQKLTLHISI